MTADLIVHNGKIITLDPSTPVVEALAIRAGKVVAAGTAADVRTAAPPRADLLDLRGRTVTPGLIDTHVHAVSVGSIGAGAALGFEGTADALNIGQAASLRELLSMIEARVRTSRKGEWIITGWPDVTRLAERRLPSRRELDGVSPDNPVLLTGYPHVRVNSYLLRQASITRDTPVPPGGEIEKEADGEPTGALAFQAVYQLLPTPPHPSVEATEKAILRVHRAFLACGLTTYKDAGLWEPAIQAYENLAKRDKLLCRSHMMYRWVWTVDHARAVAEQVEPRGDDMLVLRAVKLSLDGGIPSATAWAYDEWCSPSGEAGMGYAKMAPETLRRIVEVLHRAGFQVCCHCEGDRAIDVYLDAIEGALAAAPRADCRHTVIHCCLPTDRALARLRALGSNIAVEAQSAYLRTANAAVACGPDRSKRYKPFRRWLENGIIVGNGCDFPVEPYNPVVGLWCACTREVDDDRLGRYPYGRGECLTIGQALHTYTVGAARCLFWEDKVGSLSPGRFADFVVWSEDPYAIPATAIKELRALATAVGGEILYDAR
jgi:predicted amidohydrolase YtcJ